MEGQNIIIKKVKKKGHEGGHGGSWKVAYADFVTAMMAFFLLLWLITMAAPEKRARVSNYFKYFSIFDKGGSSMLEMNKKSHMNIVDEDSMDESSGEHQKPVPETPPPVVIEAPKASATEELEQKLKKEIETKLADIKDQIMIDSFEGGVRIELVDKEGGRPMFPLNSTELTPDGKKILSVIAESIKDSGCKMALEGHTDARTYPTKNYSNWELSTERASAARRELERNGLLPNNLIRVAGYAATEPLVKNDPYDARNRRISILLFNKVRSDSSAAAALTVPQEDKSTEKMASQAPLQKQEEPQVNDTQMLDPIQQYLFKR